MMRLMIVEDNEIVRRGLIKFLNMEPEIQIVSHVGSGAAAMTQVETGMEVDIALVDWNMADMNGLEFTSKLKSAFPDIKVIILTMHSKQDYKDKARAAGAKGYILKQGDVDELVSAIKMVSAGETIFL